MNFQCMYTCLSLPLQQREYRSQVSQIETVALYVLLLTVSSRHMNG